MYHRGYKCLSGVPQGVLDHTQMNTSFFFPPVWPIRTRLGPYTYADEYLSDGAQRTPAAHAFFFRPTPYGFRQVVQHVSNHVACEIN